MKKSTRIITLIVVVIFILSAVALSILTSSAQ